MLHPGAQHLNGIPIVFRRILDIIGLMEDLVGFAVSADILLGIGLDIIIGDLSSISPVPHSQ